MQKNNTIKKFLNKIKNKPYIIAEVGVNHECSMKAAKQMIVQAKKGGANAVKFQTYKAELLASINSPAYWDTKKEKTKNQFELFKKYDLFNQKEYRLLFKFCNKIKIDFLSTPFDLDAVNFLNPLVSFFKIASADITNYPLLKKVAQKKKIVFLSTGASNLTEIKKALNVLKKNGASLIVIMHCILNYPTKKIDANLKMIKHLKQTFKNSIIGYSDHTMPDQFMQSLTTAYILGAQVLEKHFTIDKKLKGNDHYHSMDFKDLLKLNEHIDFVNQTVGTSKKKEPLISEKISRLNARRSIIAAKNIKKGEKFTENNLIAKRPGTGISPMYWPKVLGKKANKNLKLDSVIKWRDIR